MCPSNKKQTQVLHIKTSLSKCKINYAILQKQVMKCLENEKVLKNVCLLFNSPQNKYSHFISYELNVRKHKNVTVFLPLVSSKTVLSFLTHSNVGVLLLSYLQVRLMLLP